MFPVRNQFLALNKKLIIPPQQIAPQRILPKLIRMTRQLGGGAVYENRIHRNVSACQISNLVLNPSSNTSDKNGKDLSMMFYNTPLSIELKKDMKAQMGGSSLRYNRLTLAFDMVNPHLANHLSPIVTRLQSQIPHYNNYIDALKTKEPLTFHSAVSGFPLNASVQARDALKHQGLLAEVQYEFEYPLKFLKDLYNSKGVYYIQIGGMGLYSIGGNPFRFPIPELDGTFKVEFRCGYAGQKINMPDTTSTARKGELRIIGRLKTAKPSPYSLDNQDHIQYLFARDWRTTAQI